MRILSYRLVEKKQNLKMQKVTPEIPILEKLSFDARMKILSIDNESLRAEILDTIQGIPFLYNLTKNNRKKISDYKRWNEPYNYEDRSLDPEGRIEVDITDPHRLVDMDYFRERALYFQKHGKYCDITPNRYQGSRYMRFWREEQRRCREGYVRESDGEWITGYHYWYLNYSPIQITEDIKRLDSSIKKKSSTKMRKSERKRDFPKIWDSDYLWFHYIEKAEQNGNHGVNLKSRGRGYSFKGGSSLTRNYYHYKGSNSVAIASSGDYLLGDGILNKAWDILNFIDNNTPWRKSRDYEDRKDHKKASYKDPKTKTEKGILSEIIGVTTGGDPERARGKRAKLVLFEESGKFPHFKTTLGIARPSVEQGNSVFGLIVAWGTGGTAGSDFDGIKEAFYTPKTFNMLAIPNVFSINVPSGSTCGYYCGEYMNREGCYDADGNSDVISALVEIFSGRDLIRKSSKDPNALLQEKADRSITPEEACMRKEGSIFNVEDLKIHLADVEVNPKKYTDASWKVKLVMEEGKIKWKLSDNYPIRQYPVIENKGLEGCVEIFEHPIERDGGVQSNIYVLGCDPYDDDIAGGPSLGSILVGNRLTRRIVAEYTGRPQTAEEFYEICYRLAKYYNGRINYENNKKGMFQYFDRIQATYLLCDTPGILRDMEITKKVGFGNTSKGTNATKAVNSWGNSLIRSYLMEPAYGKEEGERNYRTINSSGMLKELIAYDPEMGNYDRIAALRMLLIYMADLEKFGVTDLDAHDSNGGKRKIDPFFLRTRSSLNDRFVSIDIDKFNIKRPIRKRQR
jgi:hypothetical protein